MMKAFLLSALCLSAFGVSIRTSQTPSINVDLLQPVELAVQLFGQAFETTMQSLETQLLTILYPGNFTDVQAQLDTCEDDFVNSQVTNLQTINTDIWGLANACASEDPTAPVNKLIQDTLTLMASFSAQCDGLSVDLVGDINNLIAASIVQGIQFSTPFTGPLTQWTAVSTVPLESLPQYLTSLAQASASIASTVGVSQETIDKANADLNNEITTGNAVINDLANKGSVTQEEIVAALNAQLALASDGPTQFGEIISGSAQYVTQAVSVICSFLGPLLSYAAPAPAAEAYN